MPPPLPAMEEEVAPGRTKPSSRPLQPSTAPPLPTSTRGGGADVAKGGLVHSAAVEEGNVLKEGAVAPQGSNGVSGSFTET